MSLLQTMINSEWLIEPEYLQKMYEVATREYADKAVETYASYRLENTNKVAMRGDVAVIPVKGAIFRYANLFTEICGATSIALLAQDIQAAIDNPEVKGVLLDIDSPGGQASGINELSEIIYNARSVKPINAYAGNLAASAAYFIAAACNEIIIDDMATVGSIGVVSTINKRKDGETMEIVSSRAPNKRPDYSTDDGLRQAQERMDRLEDVFIEKVAKYRGLGIDAVVEAGNKGGVRIGKDAVKYKLCDRLGSFEGVIEEMNEKKKTQDGIPLNVVHGEPHSSSGIQEIMSPQLTEQALETLQTQAGEKATEQERTRVSEIMALSVQGAESIIGDAITAGISRDETAVKIIAHMKTQKQKESLHITPMGVDGEESMERKDEAMLINEINKRARRAI